MRTIQVINSKWYNATAWYAVYLAKILNDNGHESLVVTTPDSRTIAPIRQFQLDYECIPLNSYKPGEICQSWKMVNRLCKEFKPDLINCHRGEAFYLFAALKNKFGYKLVRTRGDQRLPKTSCLNKKLHNDVADCLITTNTAMTRFFIDKMQTDERKIHTILGGVDTAKFYPQKAIKAQIRAEYGFGENDVLLGIIGRLDNVKGFHETICAFEEAIRTDKGILDCVHLLVIGTDCDFTLESLREYSVEHHIPQENIHFYSYIDDINRVMNMLDMGIIASLGSETIARVAFEMIACHTPIIGSSVGVMPDILERQYLFEPGNSSQMAGFFHKALDMDFREKLLQSCMEHFYGTQDVNSIYGWTMDDFYQKTIHAYKQILNKE